MHRVNKLSKEQMFDWIVENNATIDRCPSSVWTRLDGTTFNCNFTLSAGNTRYSAAPTLEEAIQEAYYSQIMELQ